jgi:aminoglycoside phosphotransferase (APT) family kinase protein
LQKKSVDRTRLGRLLGTGKEAEVFEWGENVLKLYKARAPKSSAFREAAHLAVAESFGLPAPRVLGVRQIDGRWGVAMTLAAGETFGQAIMRQPALAPECLKAMAHLHMRINNHAGSEMGSMKARLRANIQRATMLGDRQRHLLLDGLAHLPEGDRLCHGDFHPWNVLGAPEGAMVVDWLDACRGDPAADICRSYVLMKHRAPELASRYVEISEALGGCDRAAIFAWLPFVAAARLAEGVPREVESLMEMAQLA